MVVQTILVAKEIQRYAQNKEIFRRQKEQDQVIKVLEVRDKDNSVSGMNNWMTGGDNGQPRRSWLEAGGEKDKLAMGHTQYMCESHLNLGIWCQVQQRDLEYGVISGHEAKELEDDAQGEGVN